MKFHGVFGTQIQPNPTPFVLSKSWLPKGKYLPLVCIPTMLHNAALSNENRDMWSMIESSDTVRQNKPFYL